MSDQNLAPEQDWSTYLSEATTEPVDDQPVVESEEEVVTEDTEEVTDDVVEPDSDETPEEPTEPLFTDDTEIELGEDRQPVKLSELKNGYLRQSDYTKKTQALADERKAFEEEVAKLQPTREWQEFIDNNPYAMQKFSEFLKLWEQGQVENINEVLEDPASARVINYYQAELAKAQKELDRLNGEYQTTKFDSDMRSLVTDLKAEYGDLITPEYETQLRQQAQQEGLSPDVLKRIAKGDLAELKLQQTQKESKKVEAKTKQKIRETKLPPQPKSKGNKPAPKEIDTSGSWMDLFKQVGNN